MSDIIVVAGKKITKEFISQALQLDRIVYAPEYQIQYETCLGYFHKNPDIYFMAIDNSLQKAIGYINFSPVKSEAFQLLLSGNVRDTIITAEDIEAYRNGVSCLGYLSSIVVHPKYRQQGIAMKMISHLSQFICELALNRDIYFTEFVADAVSDLGEKILFKMGFSSIKTSSHDSNIMVMHPFSSQTIETDYNREIIKCYQERCPERSKTDAVHI